MASVRAGSSRKQANLAVALQTRDVIGQAKGILMERYRFDDRHAVEALVAVSQHTHRKLREVADELWGLETFPVGYAPRLDGHSPLTVEQRRVRFDSAPVTGEARRRVLEARRRNAMAARQAAALHDTAARLLEASGQFGSARRAYERAANARTRASARTEMRRRPS